MDQQTIQTEVTKACLEAFPEAKAVVFWGGVVGADYSPNSSDVDVIIEVEKLAGKEAEQAQRLKLLIQSVENCRLDPFLHHAGCEPLEFVAPFGFYKANPFIPYYLKTQNAVTHGQSALLEQVKDRTLNEALKAYYPQVMSSLRRLRLDAENEDSVETIVNKNEAALFVIIRTLYSLETGEVASKSKALEYFHRKFPRFENLAGALTELLRDRKAKVADSLSPELLLAFSFDMFEALSLAHKQRFLS